MSYFQSDYLPFATEVSHSKLDAFQIIYQYLFLLDDKKLLTIFILISNIEQLRKNTKYDQCFY